MRLIDSDEAIKCFPGEDPTSVTMRRLFNGFPEVKIENKISVVLKEVLERIDSEVLESLDDGGDDWYTADKIEKVKQIIREYLNKI